MQNQSNFGFGANPTTQATTGGFQFGAQTQNTSTPNLFGTQPAASGAFKPSGFGTIATQPMSAAAPASTGGLFGSTPAQSTATSTLGLFSTPSATTAASSLFGVATSGTIPSLGSTPAVTSTGLSFGLGATANTTTPGISFGLGASTSAAPTSAAPTFGFGQASTPATKTNTTSFGLTIGAPAVTTATSFSLGLGGSTAPAVSAATTSVAPVVGLGGVATTQTKIVSAAKDVCPKEQPLPNELLQTVEAFKEMVKQQKLHSSDIARCSVRDFRKVESEIDTLTKLLGDVENQLQKNRHLAEKLKYDTAKCLQSVEIAQRTQDTPPGLQYENTAPLKYFLDLADKFEREMQSLKLQIESADNYVKNNRSPNNLTPQDLTLGIRRLHETFVALAGRLHSVHSQVESQKELYLNVRRQVLNDNSNPFDKLYKPQEVIMNNLKNNLVFSPPKVATGPTPFSNLALSNSNAMLLQQSQTANSFSSGGAAGGFGATTKAPDTSLFGNSTFAQNSSGFMLQKPPSGTKRGKQ